MVTLYLVMVMAHVFPIPIFHEVRKVQTLVMKMTSENSKKSALTLQAILYFEPLDLRDGV